jgi:hypothetical protein
MSLEPDESSSVDSEGNNIEYNDTSLLQSSTEEEIPKLSLESNNSQINKKKESNISSQPIQQYNIERTQPQVTKSLVNQNQPLNKSEKFQINNNSNTFRPSVDYTSETPEAKQTVKRNSISPSQTQKYQSNKGTGYVSTPSVAQPVVASKAEAEGNMKTIIEKLNIRGINDDNYTHPVVDEFIKWFKYNSKTDLIFKETYKNIVSNNIDSRNRNYRSVFDILIQAQTRLQNPERLRLLQDANNIIDKRINDVKNSFIINEEQKKLFINQLNELKSYIKNGNIYATLSQFTKDDKYKIDKFITTPVGHSASIPDILSKKFPIRTQQQSKRSASSSQQSLTTASLSRPSSAASSRPSTASLSSQSSAASLPESDCTSLGLIPELGDMLVLGPNSSIPQIYKFLLSNKRYCYHVMRNYPSNGDLISLINFLYNKPQELPKIKKEQLYKQIDDFPGINEIFYRIQMKSVDNLEQYITEISKKNVLFTIISKSQLVVPRILSQNYVLVSYMNEDTAMILYKNRDENITIPNPNKGRDKTVILNYQYMQFPPSITPTTTNSVSTNPKPQSIIKSNISGYGRVNPIGGKKTIRKYKKHNRNKTTRNYK